MKRATLLVLLLITQVISLGEVLNKNIVVAPVIERCKNLKPPNCIPPTAYAKVDAAHVPPNYQCPCKLTNTGDGTNGGIDGATGIPVQENDDRDFFVDEAIASGFDNPVAVAFADNGKNMFVGERGGRIWNVDLATGTKVISIDIRDKVGFSGDRGLMDIKVHPSYATVGHLMLMYTVDDTPNNGVEPDSESAQNQKIARYDIDIATGIHPTGPNKLEAEIIGGTLKNGYQSGVPLCFNTHALGEMHFGQDGSLMVSTGEGAHWNFDMGDWGQDAQGRVDPIYQNRTEALDAQCARVFGAAQDIGSWRSQVLDSLAGKILRITPDAGSGICAGSVTGGGYPVKNPYCTGPTDDGTSDRSKVWSRGLRNPFRMTMRPFDPLKDSGPGVFYFGDVGQGGYEEVNAVTGPGQNFGWPCWEGPLPSPMMRDSKFNDEPNYLFDKGCGGSEKVVAPCGPITTVAYDENNIRLTCPHMYFNKTTTLPFMYWTRYKPGDTAGYFTENAYTGQGFYGATTAGLAFYTGNKYPTKYKGKLFALDFTEKWIKVMTLVDDVYVSTMHFAELIHTIPTEGAKVSLASGPDGNICYLTLNGGEVRCFRYVDTNVAPVPIALAVENTANADNAEIQFYSDGTQDREGDEMAFLWNFGDGETSSQANPKHVFKTKGKYNVSLTTTDFNGNKGVVYLPVITDNKRPVVRVVSPIPNLPGNVFQLTENTPVNFDMSVTDEDTTVTYHWEYKFVHNSHMHDKIAEFKTKSYTDPNPPDESAIERNNLKVVATATDSGGLSGTSFVMLSRPDWLTAFGNRAPRAAFKFSSASGQARVGQPVTFDARDSYDQDGDYLTFTWTWGDGFIGNGLVTTHTYDVSNTEGFVVSLNVSDNWGYSDSVSHTVPVTPSQALVPSSSIPSGDIYGDVTVVLQSIQPGAVIYYELFQGSSVGVDVSPASKVYSTPIPIPYTAGVTATLLIKAQAATGGIPSNTVKYEYKMVPPPCTTLGLGAAGTTAAPGLAFCVNSGNAGSPNSTFQIPPKDGTTQVYTDAPPPENGVNRIVTFQIKNLVGTPYPPGNLSEIWATTNPIVWFNGGSAVGAVIKMMVEFDFKGDGSSWRREVFNNMGPDDVPASWENSENALALPNRFTPTGLTGSATYLPMQNGTIKIWFWEAIADNNANPDPLVVRSGNRIIDEKGIAQQTIFRFPYVQLYQFDNRPAGTPLPPAPPAYSGTSWPTQPPVKTVTSEGVSFTNPTSQGSQSDTSVTSTDTSMTGNPTGSDKPGNSQEPGTKPDDNGSSTVVTFSIFLVLLALL